MWWSLTSSVKGKFRFTYNEYGQILSYRSLSTGEGRHYEYDGNGNVLLVRDLSHRVLIRYTYDGAGNVLTLTDGAGNRETYTYDSMNRMVTKTNPAGTVVSYAYDHRGNQISVTNSRGEVIRFAYDGFDRLIKQVDGGGTVEYGYDANSNVVSRKDRNGDTTRYTYDGENRLTARIYPDGTSTRYTFDLKGNLLTAQNPSSHLELSYDNLDRVIQVSTKKTDFQPRANVFYTYDSRGKLSSIRDSEQGFSGRILYEYNDKGKLISTGHPSGFYVPPSSSSSKHVNGLILHYDRADRITGYRYPNGVETSLTYHPGGQNLLREIEHSLGSSTISSFTYSHDVRSYITKMSTARANLQVNSTLTYSYDTLGRLVSATRPMGTVADSFTYDVAGNRLRETGDMVDSTYGTENQLLGDKDYSYLYDKNGNRIRKTNLATGEVTEYHWSYENQLIKIVVKPSLQGEARKTAEFVYDPFGRKIQVNDNGVITRYVYDRGNIFLEFDARNIFRARYIYGQQMDSILKVERDKSPYTDSSLLRQEYYYHRDHLGNVTEITNAKGEVIQSYVYDAYGKVKIYDKKNRLIEKSGATYFKNPFTYASKEDHLEWGLLHMKNRWYDSATGTFISKDPIGLASGDDNLYRYASNNPVNFVDPYGLDVLYSSVGFMIVTPDRSFSVDVGVAFDTVTGESAFYAADGRGTGVGYYESHGPTMGYQTGSLDDFFGESWEVGGAMMIKPLKMVTYVPGDQCGLYPRRSGKDECSGG